MNSTVTLNPRISLASRRPPGSHGSIRERAYRRALRAAELAAWEAADRRSMVRPTAPPKDSDRAENVLYLTLVTVIFAAAIFALARAQDWPGALDNLTHLCRSLLT